MSEIFLERVSSYTYFLENVIEGNYFCSNCYTYCPVCGLSKRKKRKIISIFFFSFLTLGERFPIMLSIMISPNPFTPQSGWEPKVFTGRQEEITLFLDRLEKAEKDRVEHIVVLGEWGIGKTALLKHYKKVVQEKGHPSVFCPIGKFTETDKTIDDIHLILEEFIRGFGLKGVKRLLNHLESIGITVAGTGGQVTRKASTHPPQILLTDKLLDIWKELKTDLAVVLLDDIQNFSAISQIMDIIRLVLSRDEIIKNTKYLFILSCTPEGWQNFIDRHNPIGRFFRTRMSLSKLSKEEVEKGIAKTLNGTGVTFTKDIIENVYTYTQGHPYELQALCYNLYESQLSGKVGKEQWQTSIDITLRDLGRDFFDVLYRQITQREYPVLWALAKNGALLEIKDIRDVLVSNKKNFPNYPIRDVGSYIYRLVDKGILKKSTRGKYEIFDRMFQEYFLKRFEE